jgi:hydroxymethylglutaryl-CoA synthase
MLEGLGRKPSEYRYVVLHQPNTKFPQRAAKMLGFKPEQVETGLLVPVIGNTYAGSSLIGLTAVLDEARPGDKVLVISFGSGAGSDAFSFAVTERIEAAHEKALSTRDYIARRAPIDYATYVRYRGKLLMK